VADISAAIGPELRAKLIDVVARDRIPGAVAGVVHRGELAWSAALGLADVGAGRPAEPGNLFRIASITKPFTGTAIMALRDAGLLDLDDPAVRWLPELRGVVSGPASIEAVTIRRMLSHESGLPSEPPGTDWSVPAYCGDPAQVLRGAGDITLRLPPNFRHKYSDLAYQLLGEIVTRVTGIPYAQYLAESVLAPLGMRDTAFEPLASALHERRATGYIGPDLSGELEPAPPMPPVWAEGGLWSGIDDLARWVAFQLGAYRDREQAGGVLSAATLREMHRPRYLADDEWTKAWGISWCGQRSGDTVWITHSGWVPGFTGSLCFDPRSQVGAIVLFNGEPSGSTVELAISLAETARLAIPAQLPGPRPAVPDEYRPLPGLYVRPGRSDAVLVEWRNGQLAVASPEPGGWRLPLSLPSLSSEPEVFTVDLDAPQAGDQVSFHRTANGRVRAMTMFDATFVRLDPTLLPPRWASEPLCQPVIRLVCPDLTEELAHPGVRVNDEQLDAEHGGELGEGLGADRCGQDRVVRPAGREPGLG
jgi:CubicO group peptidase (beta-lactamase class C family)